MTQFERGFITLELIQDILKYQRLKDVILEQNKEHVAFETQLKHQLTMKKFDEYMIEHQYLKIQVIEQKNEDIIQSFIEHHSASVSYIKALT